MALLIKSLQVTADTPVELRKADRAVQSLTGTSRRQTVGLFHQGCVWRNAQPCTAPEQRLAVGDTIEVRYQPGQRYAKKKPLPHLGFRILFEDEHLIVVDKPAGWLTVPSPNRESNTLIQRVTNYVWRTEGRRAAVHAVHRLDRGVSGVVVLAKSRVALEELRSQFARHAPDREYLAIVAGRLEPPKGTFRSHLATNPRLDRYSTRDPQAGELAVTHYEVQQQLADATLVRVRLETGRRNQIRVQFAEAGHPVLADPRYRPSLARHPLWQARRMALHACALCFEHPATGKKCRFEVPAPAEFRRFIGSHRKS